MGRTPPIRVGHGYDLHRLAPIAPAGEGKPLVLGGVTIPSTIGPVAHSDGDALLHAVTDAILGAIAAPDIGQLFPNTDPSNAGRNSVDFLRAAMSHAAQSGYQLANVDVTVVLEHPKLFPYKSAMRAALAEALGVDVGDVNIKGKTGEAVGPVGRLEAVEVHAVVLMVQDRQPRDG